MKVNKDIITVAHKIASQRDVSVYYAMSMLDELTAVWDIDNALEYGNYIGSGIDISCNEYARQCGLKILS